MADGSVVFSTALDTSGLKGGLSGVEKSAGKWVGAVGKAFSFATIGAAIAKLGKIGIVYNSQMENYVTNFGVMLGEEAAAIEHVAELREMAAKTPFGMEDLAIASQTMLSFGMDAEYSMEAMQQLGDISLGNKERFNSLALAFSQVSAAGKLSGQDLLQMVNAGFNPLNTIAEATGTNLADLKDVMAGGKGSKDFQKAMKAAKKEVDRLGDGASEGAKMLAQIGEEGMISAEMVGMAMDLETSPGGRFYQGMEKASQTMSGMWSTLQDDATALVGNVFEPVGDVITGYILPAAIGVVGALNKVFEEKEPVKLEADTQAAVDAVTALDTDIMNLKDKYATDILTINIQANDANGIIDKIAALQETDKNLWTDADKEQMKALTTQLVELIPQFNDYVGKDGIIREDAAALRDLAEAYFEAARAEAQAGFVSAATETYENARIQQAALEEKLKILQRQREEYGLTSEELYAQQQKAFELGQQLGDYYNFGGDITPVENALAFVKEFAGTEEGLKVLQDFEGLNLSEIFDFGTGTFGNAEEIAASSDSVDALLNALIAIDDYSIEKATSEGGLDELIAQKEAEIAAVQAAIEEGTRNLETAKIDLDAALAAFASSSVSQEGEGTTPSGDGPVTKAMKADFQQAEEFVERAGPSVQQKARAAARGVKAREGIGEGEAGDGGMVSLGQQIVQEMSKGIDDSAGTARTSIINTVSSMKNAANPRQFVSVGQQIAYGIAQGIRSGTSAVAGAVMDLIKVALDTASKAAEINSPSRLFKRVIGVAIPEGVAAGIDAGTYMAVDSVNRMVAATVPDGSRIASQIMSKSAPFNGAGGSAIAAAAANGSFTQNNTFNVPVQTPDEFAKTMRLYATYGLQG